MAQTVGTIILVVIALVVVTAILNFALGLLGLVFGLLPVLIKLAIIGGIIYCCWVAVNKLSHANES
jgi:hypothetical protein